MYFLVKNIRSCTKTFRGSPNKCKLYKNGTLNWEYLARNISYFLSHPEQIKQKLKERDAHMLCLFFDSDEYKKKVSQFLETQGRILSKDLVTGVKVPGTVTYQHVLSCAQPTHKKSKVLIEPEPEPEIRLSEEGVSKKRMKRGTIFDEIIRRRGHVETQPDPDSASIESEAKPKKLRHRSTIMPIFLKKIKERRQQMEEYEDEESADVIDLPSQTARKVNKLKDQEPLYAQILHRSNFYNKAQSSKKHKRHEIETFDDDLERKPAQVSRPDAPPIMIEDPIPLKLRTVTYPRFTAKQQDPDKVSYNYSRQKNVLETVKPCYLRNYGAGENTPVVKTSSKSRLNEAHARLTNGISSVVPSRMASSAAHKFIQKAPTAQLYPKKKMNLKSFSDFLCVEPVRGFKSRKGVVQIEEANSVKIKVVKPGEKLLKKTKTKGKPISLLMEEVHKAKSLPSLKLEKGLEGKKTIIIHEKKNIEESDIKRREGREILSLFNKVKMGSSRYVNAEPLKSENAKKAKCLLERILQKPKYVNRPKEPKLKPSRDHESFTYKIVARNRERYEANLRRKFRLHPPYWNTNLGTKAPDAAKEGEKMSIQSQPLSIRVSETASIVSKNLPKKLHRPVPHFVEHPDKPLDCNLNQRHGNTNQYLVRLPKTTPEGYRVLLYSVRDPDPTKMNFNDVVKGFCMYNDCVLSEDGLQEGYIVIFDMKDVSIGHLARVSLPALKCFLYYIQDAHPCRIKQIHVLNTANWIHHVMRLVVPLVRSELLNLVRFHKGHLPEGFPLDLLPMDYGGEAPTVVELDMVTKSLLDKYRYWLIESEHLKADESKRVAKRGGFWNLFSSRGAQPVEMDEKTILKNLQID